MAKKFLKTKHIHCLIIVHTSVIPAEAGIQWLFSMTNREYYNETIKNIETRKEIAQ
ncbi:MAG: hypothetical protein JW932_18480 [Deltaproteobacteria bacterium]|nr:hypothetical protein [Deltaproteobacteria bacterium]